MSSQCAPIDLPTRGPSSATEETRRQQEDEELALRQRLTEALKKKEPSATTIKQPYKSLTEISMRNTRNVERPLIHQLMLKRNEEYLNNPSLPIKGSAPSVPIPMQQQPTAAPGSRLHTLTPPSLPPNPRADGHIAPQIDPYINFFSFETDSLDTIMERIGSPDNF